VDVGNEDFPPGSKCRECYIPITLKYHRIVAVTLSGFRKKPRKLDLKTLAKKCICLWFYCVCVCVCSRGEFFWRLSLTIIDGRGVRGEKPGFPGRREYQRAAAAAGTKPIA